jgi:hypothetical protein
MSLKLCEIEEFRLHHLSCCQVHEQALTEGVEQHSWDEKEGPSELPRSEEATLGLQARFDDEHTFSLKLGQHGYRLI